MNFWLTSQDTLEVNDLVTDLAVMYDCDDNVSGCDDDNVDDYDDDNDDDNYDDCDDDHLWGSHCCAHPTSRFSARREPSLRTAPTTVDGALAVDTVGRNRRRKEAL